MKTFTVEEANRALPLVRRIVQDIVDQYARWSELMRQVDVLAAASEYPSIEAEALQRELQRHASDIDSCLSELQSLGVEFKGYDLGLVDFPGELAGRPVYLCWRLGESSVSHWHEVDTGYAGRRPLLPHSMT